MGFFSRFQSTFFFFWKLQTASTPRKSFLFRCSYICMKCFLNCNSSAVTVCLYVGHVLCRQFSDRHKLLVEQSCRKGESLRGCIAPYPINIPRAAQEAQEGSRRMSVHPFFHLAAVEKPLQLIYKNRSCLISCICLCFILLALFVNCSQYCIYE